MYQPTAAVLRIYGLKNTQKSINYGAQLTMCLHDLPTTIWDRHNGSPMSHLSKAESRKCVWS